MIIDCRSTGMGARTFARPMTDGISIRQFGWSGTGNHWREEITGTGMMVIIDVSNSGRHYCRLVETADGRERREWLSAQQAAREGGPCPCELQPEDVRMPTAAEAAAFDNSET